MIEHVEFGAAISANLSREDRAYLGKLGAQLLALLKGKHVREIKDTVTLRQVLELVKARGDYLRMNAQQRAEQRDPRTVEVLKARTAEGVEVEIDLTEKMKEWQTFYADEKVDWVKNSFPEKLKVSPDQAQEMQKLMEMGYTEMIIVPSGLVDEPVLGPNGIVTDDSKKNTMRLYRLMMKGFAVKKYRNYENSGGIGCSSGVGGARILLVKPVKDLNDDAQYAATIGKTTNQLNTETVETLNIPGFSESEQNKTLKELGLLGFDEVSYWLLQRKFFNKTGYHLDSEYVSVHLSLFQGSRRVGSVFAPVPGGLWLEGQMLLDAVDQGDHKVKAGSRLAGRWEF